MSKTTSFRDYLAPSGYQFFIKRLPQVSFTVQTVAIPSLVLPTWQEPTPFVPIPVEGNNLIYGDLRLSFIVADDLSNYIELHDWLRALGHAQGFEEFAALRMEHGVGLRSTCTLGILNARKNLSKIVTFDDAVPTELDPLVFDARLVGGEWQYLIASATFKFRSFTIESV